MHLFATEREGRDWLTGVGIAEPRRTGAADEFLGISEQLGIGSVTLLMHARAQLLATGREVDQPEVLHRIRSYNSWGLNFSRGRDQTAVVVGVDAALMSESALRAEIAFGHERGAAGIKLVPASNRIYGDDSRVFPIYDEATRRKIVVVAQSGHSGAGGDRGDPFGRPKHFASALAEFPELVIVFAHFGEGYEREVLELGSRFEGVHADLSMQLKGDTDESRLAEIANLIHTLGSERVMFGSNYPIANPITSAGQFAQLERHGIDVEQVGYGTWNALFGSRLQPSGAPSA